MRNSTTPSQSPTYSTRQGFIRTSTLGAAGLALSGSLGANAGPPVPTNPAGPVSDAALFAQRSTNYLRQVLDVARGPCGLIISHSNFDTRRPLQEGDVSPVLHQVLDSVWGRATPKPTAAEWYYGENTAWATGWLLWSQMIRYRVTQEDEALRVARKCFQDLNHMFALSRPLQAGVLGKPHGGRGGETTSFDQSANPILHYANFARDFGTPEEKEVARRNMVDNGDYYLRRDWVMNHHGNLTGSRTNRTRARRSIMPASTPPSI